MCEPLSHCTNQSILQQQKSYSYSEITIWCITDGNNHSNICSHTLQQGTVELCQQLKQINNKTTLALHAVINQLPLNITFPSEDTQKHQVIFSSGVNDLMLILKLATINALTSGAGLYTFSFSYHSSAPAGIHNYNQLPAIVPLCYSSDNWNKVMVSPVIMMTLYE